MAEDGSGKRIFREDRQTIKGSRKERNVYKKHCHWRKPNSNSSTVRRSYGLYTKNKEACHDARDESVICDGDQNIRIDKQKKITTWKRRWRNSIAIQSYIADEQWKKIFEYQQKRIQKKDRQKCQKVGNGTYKQTEVEDVNVLTHDWLCCKLYSKEKLRGITYTYDTLDKPEWKRL